MSPPTFANEAHQVSPMEARSELQFSSPDASSYQRSQYHDTYDQVRHEIPRARRASDQAGLEVPQAGLEVVQSTNQQNLSDVGAIAYPAQYGARQSRDYDSQVFSAGKGSEAPIQPEQEEETQKRRICGLSVPTLVFLIMLALLVVGASVGGAVGGIAATQ
ncbi:hypothetical protein E8E14_013221 [Neopestalotiopsis sp. 37M]|nr:hypothetical protein E8E14_013221 [Neopestalotiopsis sp. 37M]